MHFHFAELIIRVSVLRQSLLYVSQMNVLYSQQKWKAFFYLLYASHSPPHTIWETLFDVQSWIKWCGALVFFLPFYLEIESDHKFTYRNALAGLK